MDFAVTLIIANSLLAAFIYFILNWLWQGKICSRQERVLGGTTSKVSEVRHTIRES